MASLESSTAFENTEEEEDRDFLEDNDAIFTLPLKYVPLQTTSLRRSRLTKTYSLDTAVEMFRYGEGLRAYFLIEDVLKGALNEKFGWPPGGQGHDAQLLKTLSSINSYDVFNLRIQFRESGIDYEGIEYLALSPEMKSELSVYMRQFTQPLIQLVFGDRDVANSPQTDIIDLFRNPGAEEPARNLKILAGKLNIQTSALPDFLHNFSEVYMAISYYKNYADNIGVMNAVFMSELDYIHTSLQWKSDPDIEKICVNTKEIMKSVFFEVYQRLDVFERETKNFWADLNPSRFRDLEWMLRDSQMMLGGVLCGLGRKLAGWRERFPTADHGSAPNRYEVLKNEFRPGLSSLVQLAAADMRETKADDPH